MLCIKKLKFTKKELQKLAEDFDGYLWLAIDIKRSVIAAGDEFMADLRDVLLARRSRTEDIVTAGIDLKTGEIYIPYHINRLNPEIRHTGLTDEIRARVEDLVSYFFAEMPIVSEATSIPAASLVYN